MVSEVRNHIPLSPNFPSWRPETTREKSEPPTSRRFHWVFRDHLSNDFIRCLYLVNMLGWFCPGPVLWDFWEAPDIYKKAFVYGFVGANLLLTDQLWSTNAKKFSFISIHTLWLSPLHLLIADPKHMGRSIHLKGFKIYWFFLMPRQSFFPIAKEAALFLTLDGSSLQYLGWGVDLESEITQI